MKSAALKPTLRSTSPAPRKKVSGCSSAILHTHGHPNRLVGRGERCRGGAVGVRAPNASGEAGRRASRGLKSSHAHQ